MKTRLRNTPLNTCLTTAVSERTSIIHETSAVEIIRECSTIVEFDFKVEFNLFGLQAEIENARALSPTQYTYCYTLGYNLVVFLS